MFTTYDKRGVAVGYEDTILWGIHGGRTGDADTLFLKQKYIALGWDKMPDLSRLEANREAFKAILAECYPDKKPGAIPIEAGQLFRFIHEIQVGDIIIYPSQHDKLIHIGEVEGEYQYNPGRDSGYPHQRPVKWLETFPRTRFTQGALYETGSAMSLFQVKNYADEFVAALEGKSIETLTEDTDETVGLVAEEIEQTTRDFVLKQLGRELKGHPLSHFVAHLLQQMGFQTRVSPEGPDSGIDIIAHRDELGFEPPIIKVQVKSGSGNIGAPEVQALYGNIHQSGEYGLFVTLSSFSNQAKNFARGTSNLRLIDGTELVELVLQYYENFDARYKGLIPLKRVYIPQSLGESED